MVVAKGGAAGQLYGASVCWILRPSHGERSLSPCAASAGDAIRTATAAQQKIKVGRNFTSAVYQGVETVATDYAAFASRLGHLRRTKI